jgi:vacuolar-type H+-ATPase subunit E/Vma4
MIASTEYDRIVVHNTLESRVERAKEVMKLEIYSLLYG